jgi:TPR repeat protein
MRAITPRPISDQESAVVRAVLERAAFKSCSPPLIGSVASLTVVGICECGCASVSFAEPQNWDARAARIGEGYGSTAAGAEVGAVVWGTSDAVVSLEIYTLGHDDGSLPLAESIGVMALRDRNDAAEADPGNVVSQGFLGIMYLQGRDGVPQNYEEAFRLLTKAANRGASRPSVWLGTMYEGGLGVPVDLERARQLYQCGADRGELFGCIFLARLLASGRLGSVDQSGALQWYRAALNLSGVAAFAELDEARAYVQNHSDVGA